LRRHQQRAELKPSRDEQRSLEDAPEQWISEQLPRAHAEYP
jgi:hypothetical protein